MKKKVQVMLVDDHAIVRKGVAEILESSGSIRVIAEAGNTADALDLLSQNDIDVILLDINLPDRQGLDIIDQIKEQSPHTAVLVVSMYPAQQYAIRALKAGAAGYLKKDTTPEELISSVYKVSQGAQYVSPEVAEILASTLQKDADAPSHHLLSDREFQVFRLIASGVKLKDIAEQLSLSPKTVSTYRTRILEKLDLTSNADLVLYAEKHSII